MLVLTRKLGERIVIGETVTITVVDIKGDTVRLGIDAPREVRVQRSEVLEQIAAETADAASAPDDAAAKLLGLLHREAPTSDAASAPAEAPSAGFPHTN